MKSLLLFLSLLISGNTQNDQKNKFTHPPSHHRIEQQHDTSVSGLSQLFQKMNLEPTPRILDAFEVPTPHSRGLLSSNNTLVWQNGSNVLYKVGPEFQVNTYIMSSQSYPSVASLSNGGFVVTWTSGCSSNCTGQDSSSYGIYGQLYHSNGAKVGPEFKVNTYTTNSQEFVSVASLPGGGFVVTRESSGQDDSGYGVYAQLYSDTGTKVGPEFQVNTYTASSQGLPSVVSLSTGGFVVTWDSTAQSDVHGQLYSSTGTRVDSEFRVNTNTTNLQRYPSVASLSNGGFVVTWQSFGQDGSSWGVYGQLYSAHGTKIGSEFQVNTYTNLNQIYPSVAGLSTGGFVVTWQSNNWQDGSDWGVYGQLYSSSGTRVGAEFQINTHITHAQKLPCVAGLLGGSFVVTWTSWDQDGYGNGVYGQLYNNNGAKIGSEFQVNTFATSSDQEYSSVAGLPDGGFVIAWQSLFQDGSGWGIYGQLYSSTGTKLGSEFRVNTYTASNEVRPSVAGLLGGGFVVTWHSNGQDGSNYGVYGQLFELGTPSPTASPTQHPTQYPTYNPTIRTTHPTQHPTNTPSNLPTQYPSVVPSIAPTYFPSLSPSFFPSATPTYVPSISPTYYPSISPSMYPSLIPSYSPSTYPTYVPSLSPSLLPSATPTTAVPIDIPQGLSLSTSMVIVLTAGGTSLVCLGCMSCWGIVCYGYLQTKRLKKENQTLKKRMQKIESRISMSSIVHQTPAPLNLPNNDVLQEEKDPVDVKEEPNNVREGEKNPESMIIMYTKHVKE